MRFWQILFSCGCIVAFMLIVNKAKTLCLGLSQSFVCPPVGQGQHFPSLGVRVLLFHSLSPSGLGDPRDVHRHFGGLLTSI